jgi:DNA-directed RNA polymerase specialized sigma24 family protein
MAVAQKRSDAELDPAAVMLGVLAMLVAEREDRIASDESKSLAKTELVLSNVGFNATEIAGLMGKNVEAVRKAIQRARK